MNDFQNELSRYQAYWINRLTYNVIRGRIKMSLVANPEREEVVAKVTFHKVRDLRSEFIGKEEEADIMFLPALVGIGYKPEGERTRFLITMETAEMTFVTDQEPIIEWLDKDKKFRQWEEEQWRKDWD